VKAYQVANKAKFAEKWARELVQHYPPDPKNVERAARRLLGGDIVVVFDHYVPRPDEDAGSVRMSGLVKTLRTQGHAVIFVPDDRLESGAYGRSLENGGVEVIHGDTDLGSLLTNLRGSVSGVVLSRAMIAVNNILTVREVLPTVPVVFDTVDLHFLRAEREGELIGVGSSRSSTAMREIELALLRACDTTLVVSPFERDLLGRLVPGADVRVLSNVHQRVDDEAIPQLSGRAGLVFVGSFAHTPNSDGVRWFTEEVLPLVRRQLPDIPLTVVGRNPDPKLVSAAPPGVEYAGWVEDLGPVYGAARAVIAPLRYGAGVKGKIGEAMSFGVPVVMTPVGAEGMGIEDGRTALIAESATDFAAAVVRLVTDDSLWTRIALEAREHIDAVLGQRAFSDGVAELFKKPDER
jgi:glycosyltransferase involved in cell wall biosynthesis